jgi:hypothetical protein
MASIPPFPYGIALELLVFSWATWLGKWDQVVAQEMDVFLGGNVPIQAPWIKSYLHFQRKWGQVVQGKHSNCGFQFFHSVVKMNLSVSYFYFIFIFYFGFVKVRQGIKILYFKKFQLNLKNY